jgi:RimJ/RimL family protein N-acetyltransferase
VRIDAARLTLTSISPELARRIVAREPVDDDAWHAEYPFEDELVPLRALAADPNPHPAFTLYQIRRRADGLAVGGLGFFGPPDASGRVEFGYGLVPSARGAGLATEAVVAALTFARDRGATIAEADTDLGNLPSQHVLVKAGLTETHRDHEKIYYRCRLPDALSDSDPDEGPDPRPTAP